MGSPPRRARHEGARRSSPTSASPKRSQTARVPSRTSRARSAPTPTRCTASCARSRATASSPRRSTGSFGTPRRPKCFGVVAGWDDFAHLFGGVWHRAAGELDATPADPPFRRIFGTDFWSWLARNPSERAAFDRAMVQGVGPQDRAARRGRVARRRDGRGRRRRQRVAARRARCAGSPACAGSSSTCPRRRATRRRSATAARSSPATSSSASRPATSTSSSTILHDWDDERAAAILRTIRAAAPPGTRGCSCSSRSCQPGNEPDGAKWLDLLMLALFAGRERDEAQWRALLDGGRVRARADRGRADRGAMPLTVGTAGHIDHGKTWLVRALTGKDTDRLPEEQERGISIDLGYAPLELPGGRRLSLVDVPGHERFVRNMVAGATGIDLFLLVVDAAEGARPQTHEHLAIVRLLGIEHGVVAVTKVDAVDAETRELALEEARELVPGRARRGDERARPAKVSTSCARRSRRPPTASSSGRRARPTRLFVDRAFTLRGIGTVVTGTLWSGSIGEGDVAPRRAGGARRPRPQRPGARPAGRAGRGGPAGRGRPPGRRAATSSGAATRSSSRAPIRVSYRLDIALDELGRSPDGRALHVHHGTAEHFARVVRVGERYAQLRLAAPGRSRPAATGSSCATARRSAAASSSTPPRLGGRPPSASSCSSAATPPRSCSACCRRPRARARRGARRAGAARAGRARGGPRGRRARRRLVPRARAARGAPARRRARRSTSGRRARRSTPESRSPSCCPRGRGRRRSCLSCRSSDAERRPTRPGAAAAARRAGRGGRAARGRARGGRLRRPSRSRTASSRATSRRRAARPPRRRSRGRHGGVRRGRGACSSRNASARARSRSPASATCSAPARKPAQLLLERFDADGLTRRVGDERVLRRRARR